MTSRIALLVLVVALFFQVRRDQDDVRSLQGTEQQQQGEQQTGPPSGVASPPPASPPEREVHEPSTQQGDENRVRPEMRGPAEPGR